MDAFEAISDPSRRAILRLLLAQPLTAGEIAACFEISRPATSRHLRHLREAGLVSVEIIGRHHVYRLRPESLRPVIHWVRQFEQTVPESVIDAFETEVYRTRRDHRRFDGSDGNRLGETA